MGWSRNPVESAESLNNLRISPSSINTYRGCPRRWFYEYIMAMPTLPSIHLVRGNVVHHVLEYLFKQSAYPGGEAFRPAMMEKGMELLNSKWEEEVKEDELKISKEEIKKYYENSKTMIERFISNYCDTVQAGIIAGDFSSERQGYYFTRPKFKELWLDDQFQYDSNGKALLDANGEKIQRTDDVLKVGGFIDAVNKDFDNNYVLVDYKTSKKYQNALSEEYTLQLSIYAYLWQKVKGWMPTYVAIKYLRYNETYFIVVTPSMIKEATDKIKDMRKQIVENGLEECKYRAKESKLCGWCPFQEECSIMENKLKEEAKSGKPV